MNHFGFSDWAKGKLEKCFNTEPLSCSAEGSDVLLASSLLQSVLSLGEKVLRNLRLVCATASCCCFIIQVLFGVVFCECSV